MLIVSGYVRLNLSSAPSAANIIDAHKWGWREWVIVIDS
jgi:hypothetical protein